MRHLQKIRETDAGPIDFHWFHDFFLDISSLSFSFFLNADIVTIKDDTSKYIRETNGGKIKELPVF